jgi:hypothetical protein
VTVAALVPVAVPVVRALAVAVWQTAVTAPLTALPMALAVPLAPLPATLVSNELTVGARLVAEPVSDVAAALSVGARVVADPDTAVIAAFADGAARVAAPVTVVAALLVVAVAPELLHAARNGSAASATMTAVKIAFVRVLFMESRPFIGPRTVRSRKLCA